MDAKVREALERLESEAASPHGSPYAEDYAATIRAHIEGLEADALRYRWLRDDPPLELAVRQRNDTGWAIEYGYMTGKWLDAAIDAAMRGGDTLLAPEDRQG
jgi:hypothetical protein